MYTSLRILNNFMYLKIIFSSGYDKSFVIKQVDSIIQKLSNDVPSKVHTLLSPETSNSTNANSGPESSFLGQS